MERSLSRSASTLSQPRGGARAARCPALGTGLGGVHAVRVLLMIPYIFALLFSWVLVDVRLDRAFFSSPVPFLSSDVGACVPNLVRALGVVATMLSHVLEAYRRRKLTLAGAPAAHHRALISTRLPTHVLRVVPPRSCWCDRAFLGRAEASGGPKPRTGAQHAGRVPSGRARLLLVALERRKHGRVGQLRLRGDDGHRALLLRRLPRRPRASNSDQN